MLRRAKEAGLLPVPAPHAEARGSGSQRDADDADDEGKLEQTQAGTNPATSEGPSVPASEVVLSGDESEEEVRGTLLLFYHFLINPPSRLLPLTKGSASLLCCG